MVQREEEEGRRWSTPLVRWTDFAATAARRRELATSLGEEVAGREGRRSKRNRWWYIDFWREKGIKLHIPPLLIDNEEMGLSSLLLYFALLFTALCWAPSVCGNAELRALMDLKSSLNPENALLKTSVVGRLEHLTGMYLHYRITKR
nr:probable LRR receptor-like serine/threonine-protein kinase At5g10290 [Ipomoea batatas]